MKKMEKGYEAEHMLEKLYGPIKDMKSYMDKMGESVEEGMGYMKKQLNSLETKMKKIVKK